MRNTRLVALSIFWISLSFFVVLVVWGASPFFTENVLTGSVATHCAPFSHEEWGQICYGILVNPLNLQFSSRTLPLLAQIITVPFSRSQRYLRRPDIDGG